MAARLRIPNVLPLPACGKFGLGWQSGWRQPVQLPALHPRSAHNGLLHQTAKG